MTEKEIEAAIQNAANGIEQGFMQRGGHRECVSILRNLITEVTTEPCPECHVTRGHDEHGEFEDYDGPCPAGLCHDTGRIPLKLAGVLEERQRIEKQLRKIFGDEAIDNAEEELLSRRTK